MEVTQKQLELLTERIARKLSKELEQASQGIILDALVAFCETIDPDLVSINTEELVWCVRKLAEINGRGEYYPLLEASQAYNLNICPALPHDFIQGYHDFIPMTAEEAYLGREMSAEDRALQADLGSKAYIKHLKELATFEEPPAKLGSEVYMRYLTILAAVKE